MTKGRIDEEVLKNTMEGALAEQEKAQEYCDKVFGYIFGDAEIERGGQKKSFEKVLEMVRGGKIPVPSHDPQMAPDIGAINAILRFSQIEKGGFLALNPESIEANQGLQIAGSIIATQGNDKKRTILSIVNSLNHWAYNEMAKNNSLAQDKNVSPSPSSSPQNKDSEPFLPSKTLQNYLEKRGEGLNKSQSNQIG